MSMHRQVEEAVRSLRARIAGTPEVAVILGSGLGGFAGRLRDPVAIPSAEIPFYPHSTVEGHKGELVFGILRGRRVLAVRGRVHFYETNDLNTILFPVRVLAALGVPQLLITNAAGGINRMFVPGDLMVITDQINMTGIPIPPDVSVTTRRIPYYDPELSALIISTAASLGLRLVTGVYAGVKGPSYETAGEVEMLHRLGGDAVGMSTVVETALAHALGLKVAGISCITNRATGTSPAKLDHAEVTAVANRVKEHFSMLLSELIARMP
ncbi:MAG: purine-nucleoside phosphorylase [Bacteroidetes bacterium]|jgi:purine-nucleoside phosphorylase|nr:purine-nucleoside phosphorylase [Bacteroidota bacterium]